MAEPRPWRARNLGAHFTRHGVQPAVVLWRTDLLETTSLPHRRTLSLSPHEWEDPLSTQVTLQPVAAGAVVAFHVPDHTLVMAVSARERGWMCACGTRLQGAGNIVTGVTGPDYYCLSRGAVGRDAVL